MKIELAEMDIKLILKLLEVSDPLNLYTMPIRNKIVDQVNGETKIVKKENP